MSSLAIRQQIAQSERRRSGRMLIAIPVALRTVSGLRECNMSNISDTGAKLEMEKPPVTGISGWLVMGEDEIYCTVVWSNEGTCGVEFERSLGPNRLKQVAGDQIEPQELGPAANRGNIQMGRKRSSLVVRRD